MLRQLQTIAFPNWLADLTSDSIKNAPLPLFDLLRESLYYPSCGFDGDPIKHMGGNVLSFVYVDYGHTRDAFMSALRFTGYEPVAHRFVTESELSLNSHGTSKLCLGESNPLPYHHYIKESFCVWPVFQRRAEFPAMHGPVRFSLLFICADGVATFEALYVANRVAPKVVAVIQPGHAFGYNWTDFTDAEQVFARMVLANIAGQPEMILFGGISSDWRAYESPCWPTYKILTRRFQKTGGGTVGIWSKNLSYIVPRKIVDSE